MASTSITSAIQLKRIGSPLFSEKKWQRVGYFPCSKGVSNDSSIYLKRKHNIPNLSWDILTEIFTQCCKFNENAEFQLSALSCVSKKALHWGQTEGVIILLTARRVSLLSTPILRAFTITDPIVEDVAEVVYQYLRYLFKSKPLEKVQKTIANRIGEYAPMSIDRPKLLCLRPLNCLNGTDINWIDEDKIDDFSELFQNIEILNLDSKKFIHSQLLSKFTNLKCLSLKILKNYSFIKQLTKLQKLSIQMGRHQGKIPLALPDWPPLVKLKLQTDIRRKISLWDNLTLPFSLESLHLIKFKIEPNFFNPFTRIKKIKIESLNQINLTTIALNHLKKLTITKSNMTILNLLSPELEFLHLDNEYLNHLTVQSNNLKVIKLNCPALEIVDIALDNLLHAELDQPQALIKQLKLKQKTIFPYRLLNDISLPLSK